MYKIISSTASKFAGTDKPLKVYVGDRILIHKGGHITAIRIDTVESNNRSLMICKLVSSLLQDDLHV